MADIINKLDPFIKTTIEDALGSHTVTALEQGTKDEAISNVLGSLVPLIRQAVHNVMTRLQAAGTLNSHSDGQLITKVNKEMGNGNLFMMNKSIDLVSKS